MGEGTKASSGATANPQNAASGVGRTYSQPRTYEDSNFGVADAAKDATQGLRKKDSIHWDLGNGRTLTYDTVSVGQNRFHETWVTNEDGGLVDSRQAKTAAGLYKVMDELRKKYERKRPPRPTAFRAPYRTGEYHD